MTRGHFTEAYTVVPHDARCSTTETVLPEWTGTRAWILNRPVGGSATAFAQYVLEIAPDGGSRDPEPELDVQSFIFVLDGSLTVRRLGRDHVLAPGGFAYLPPETLWSAFNDGPDPVKFAWIRKTYQQLAGHTPAALFGSEADQGPPTVSGTGARVHTVPLIPADDVAYDLNVDLVTILPGTDLPLTEVHAVEQGMHVLEGNAVFRLNQDWVEVEEGDYLSLRAFCPQSCSTGGPSSFRYLRYRDGNRQVLLGGR